jgi:hypothetical protein
MAEKPHGESLFERARWSYELEGSQRKANRASLERCTSIDW